MIWETYPIAAATGFCVGYALKKYANIALDHIYSHLGEKKWKREQDPLGGENIKPDFNTVMKIAGKDIALAERLQIMLDANFGEEDASEIFVSLHHACEHNPWSEVEAWNISHSREEAFAIAEVSRYVQARKRRVLECYDNAHRPER